MSLSKFIETELVDGTFEGIKILECATTIQAIVVPRIKISESIDIPRLNQAALYFLVGEEDNRVYIGKTGNFLRRLATHDKNKDWWSTAIVIVSKADELTPGDVEILESLAIHLAKASSSELMNATAPIVECKTRSSASSLGNILKDTELLLRSLGYDILVSPKKDSDKEDLWYLRYKNLQAKGEYRGNQFVILKGSFINIESSEAWKKDFPKVEQQRLDIIETKSTKTNDSLVLSEPIAFKSVSLAAGIVTGRHANGWKMWKNKDGKTMDEVIRKSEI
jgi:hypothetical protein